jgi:hypothetical protein
MGEITPKKAIQNKSESLIILTCFDKKNEFKDNHHLKPNFPAIELENRSAPYGNLIGSA